MTAWQIPEPLATGWPMRTPDSAKISAHRMVFLNRWRQHNVEEIGNLPHFLPDLHNQGGRLT